MVHSSQWKWYCLVTPEADFCRQNNFVNTPAVAHRCVGSSPLVFSLIRVSSNLDLNQSEALELHLSYLSVLITL